LYRRRRPFRLAFLFRFWVFWFIMLLLAGGIFFWVDRAMRTTILKIAEVEVVQMANEAIYKSVQQELWSKNLEYQDFVQVQKDNLGHVVFIQANTVKITRTAADIALVAQQSLCQLEEQKLSLPLGILTGTQLLANKGPKVRVAIMPIGTVKVNIKDKFEPAGINQTRHQIWLDFDTQVKIAIPTMSADSKVVAQVPLAESIIVGDVPGTFVNVTGGLFAGGLGK